jgi:DNA topoisomerase-3
LAADASRARGVNAEDDDSTLKKRRDVEKNDGGTSVDPSEAGGTSVGELYLCEKPDQGKSVAEGLGGAVSADRSRIVCASGDVVTWGYGHLVALLSPEDYDPAFASWSQSVGALPIVPKTFRYKPRGANHARQLKIIADLLSTASGVVIATDADREGELIAHLILRHLRWNGKTRRLWLSDLTLPAVREALGRLEPASKTLPLYHAALARSCSDWLVGMNVTRAATVTFRAGPGDPLSIGRVQTPVLALIVRNQRAIDGFVPKDYHEFLAEVMTAGGHRLIMRHAPPADARIHDPAQAAGILARIQGAKGNLSVSTENKTQAPPPLFDLNLLQQEANSRFGWPASKTLKIAQDLYMTKKCLSYPRTDSSALPQGHASRAPAILAILAATPELASLAPALAAPIIRPSVYDDKGVKSHHAIVPTLLDPGTAGLDPDETKLYLLVARRFAAAHLPDHGYQETVVSLDAGGIPLRLSGRIPLVRGWKDAFEGLEAEDEEEKDDDETPSAAALPPVKNGEAAQATRAKIDVKRTKPPRRFTEKSLLNAMKDIAAHIDDPAAKARLRKTSGIGTSATRAGIIETLKERGYVETRKRQLFPSEIGSALIAAMEAAAPSYCDPAETAAWEDVLEDIIEGRATGDAFVAKIADKVAKDVAVILGMKTPPRIGQKGRPVFADEAERKAALDAGTPLVVPYEKRETAKKLGAAWDGERRAWIMLADADPTPFKKAGLLDAGRSKTAAKPVYADEGERKAAVAGGIPVKVPYADREKAKKLGGVWDGERKTWIIPAGVDPTPFRKAGFVTET